MVKGKIGIADTMFSRINTAEFCLKEIEKENKKGSRLEIERYTVPGFKDLPVACKKLFNEFNCDIVIALGWAGKAEIDQQCAHEANLGLMQVQIEAGKHIMGVFIHENESEDEKILFKVAGNRASSHARNAIALLKGKTELTSFAGKGIRQGFENEGEIKEK